MGTTSIKEEPVETHSESRPAVLVTLSILLNNEKELRALSQCVALIKFSQGLAQIKADEGVTIVEEASDYDTPRDRRTRSNPRTVLFIESNHRECQTTKKNSRKCNNNIRNVNKRATMVKSNNQGRQLYGSSMRKHKNNK